MSTPESEGVGGGPAGSAGSGRSVADSAGTANRSAESRRSASDSSTTARPAKRTSSVPDVQTTSRSKKKKQKRDAVDKLKMKRGMRVKVRRDALLHILQGEGEDEQKKVLHRENNYRWFYGKVISGDVKNGYKIRFDEFPHHHQDVNPVRRTIIHLVADGEEEPTHAHSSTVVDDDADEDADDDLLIDEEENKKLDPETAAFVSHGKEHVANAKSFSYDGVEWTILGDDEVVDDMALDAPPKAQYKKDIPWNEKAENMDYNEVFFEHFFPSIKGHAKLIDKYHSSPKSLMSKSVADDNIRFEDETADDPDWKVRVCYTLLIAAASELDNGVDELWKKGKSSGRHMHADFGRYIPKNYFKAFQAAAPFCWCEEKYWYSARDDLPWDVFMPCLQQFNEKRRAMLKVVLLMLDESMSGWRPKTSKLGGLPNYTYEPRKPVPLGTMFKNGAECITGMLVYQDVVQLSERQSKKEFSQENSYLPGNPKIQPHVAEVLRQTKNAGVIENGWVGGDSWFGSVMAAVEVRRRLKVHSSWIIKNNCALFPKKALLAVLRARFDRHPAGHWVVFRATVADVPLFAMVYAWSQKGVSMILSTCGGTEVHAQKYRTKFENEWGGVSIKEYPRPAVAHFLYDFLPLIDEHNKQRQNLLGLERVWKTRCCWFRLLTTLLGMCVVDCHRWDKNMRAGGMATRREENDDDDGDIVEQSLRIRKFSDLICDYLTTIEKKNRATPRPAVGRQAEPGTQEQEYLVRITNRHGSTTKEPTTKDIRKGKTHGGSVVQNCWICRKYLLPNGATKYQQTSHKCKDCGMPLCAQDRSGNVGRSETCLHEHLTSPINRIGCPQVERDWTCFPVNLQVNNNPPSSGTRKRQSAA